MVLRSCCGVRTMLPGKGSHSVLFPHKPTCVYFNRRAAAKRAARKEAS